MEFHLLLSAVVSRLGLAPKPDNRGWHTRICPFHDDHNPSLRISPRGFRCMACGEICPVDGRRFRGFITHRDCVSGVLARLEVHTPASESGVALKYADAPQSQSKTSLERDNA